MSIQKRWTWAALALVATWATPEASGVGPGRSVEVAIDAAGDVPVAEIVDRLARASGISVERPPAGLSLSTRGLSRALARAMLAEALGPGVEVAFRPGWMVLTIDEYRLAPDRQGEWAGRLRDLSARAAEAARRRENYGMRGRASYRPNDPGRPTVCLVHGLNSSSGGFVHLIPWLEEAGYGVVVHDYPFNRPIAESCERFARDWSAFRKQAGERRPWAILAHSMGALLARSLIEDDATWGGDVSSMILVAPVNSGSHLARMQTMIQLVEGLQSIRSKKTARAMLDLSEGVGEAANDMLPGSPFLVAMNRRPRRAGVPYHIIAGDVGFLDREGRARIEARLDLLNRNAGIFGRLAQAATADVPALLDELTDGTGDGCVAVDRTRLAGVSDHVSVHANHAELIRAPLLFRDPGPVACMPETLRWLAADCPRPAR